MLSYLLLLPNLKAKLMHSLARELHISAKQLIMNKTPTTRQQILSAFTGFLITVAILTQCCARTQEYPLPAYTIRDKQFLIGASSFNQTEVQAGRMAAARGVSPGIRLYGATTAQKYQAAEHELSLLASSLQIPLPQGPDSTRLSSIAAVYGDAFDIAFVSGRITDLRQAIDLFQTQLTYGSDTSVKAYAGKYLPLLQAHLAWADSLSGRAAH